MRPSSSSSRQFPQAYGGPPPQLRGMHSGAPAAPAVPPLLVLVVVVLASLMPVVVAVAPPVPPWLAVPSGTNSPTSTSPSQAATLPRKKAPSVQRRNPATRLSVAECGVRYRGASRRAKARDICP